MIKDKYVFGRHSTCDVQLKGLAISNKHFVICKDAENDYVCLIDESTNGTFIDNVRIAKKLKTYLTDKSSISILTAKNNIESKKDGNFRGKNRFKMTKVYQFENLEEKSKNKHTDHPLTKYEFSSKVLGKGSFAEVFLAVDKQTNRSVAIKVINKNALKAKV